MADLVTNPALDATRSALEEARAAAASYRDQAERAREEARALRQASSQKMREAESWRAGRDPLTGHRVPRSVGGEDSGYNVARREAERLAMEADKAMAAARDLDRDAQALKRQIPALTERLDELTEEARQRGDQQAVIEQTKLVGAVVAGGAAGVTLAAKQLNVPVKDLKDAVRSITLNLPNVGAKGAAGKQALENVRAAIAALGDKRALGPMAARAGAARALGLAGLGFAGAAATRALADLARQDGQDGVASVLEAVALAEQYAAYGAGVVSAKGVLTGASLTQADKEVLEKADKVLRESTKRSAKAASVADMRKRVAAMTRQVKGSEAALAKVTCSP